MSLKQAADITGLSEATVRRWYTRFQQKAPRDPSILASALSLDQECEVRWLLGPEEKV
ncbi:MAG: hypothetical protein AMXMBFR82_07080 [Candidatus Hydrogenedentota bacterium]